MTFTRARDRAVAIVMVLSIVAAAQESVPPDLAGRVAALVDRLDADQFAIRRAAERELITIGPDALQHLPRPQASMSLQMRVSLEEIRRQLLNQRAVSSLDASKVTLKGNLNPDQIVAAIRQQTGNAVSVARLDSETRGKQLPVDYQAESFWAAVADLAERTSTRTTAQNGAVHLLPEQAPAAAVSEHGPYRVGLRDVRRRPFAGDQTRDLLRLRLQFAAEPRLRVLFAKAAGSAVNVLADNQTELLPFSPNQSLELPVGGRGESVDWNHDVFIPADQAARKVDATGEIHVLMASGYERFEFPRLANAKRSRQKRTGVFLLVNDVEMDEGRGHLSLTLTVNWIRSVSAFDSYRTWQFHNEAWLETPDGQRIDFAGPLRTDAQAGGAVRLTYHFRGVTAPLRECRFVYEAPTTLKTVTVPFRFSGVAVESP